VMLAATSLWFRKELERLFGLLAARAIRPRVADGSLDEVAEAHRRIGADGLQARPAPRPERQASDRSTLCRIEINARRIARPRNVGLR
jgi:NADPH:quinone reductase